MMLTNAGRSVEAKAKASKPTTTSSSAASSSGLVDPIAPTTVNEAKKQVDEQREGSPNTVSLVAQIPSMGNLQKKRKAV
jgi:hypothetical protein